MRLLGISFFLTATLCVAAQEASKCPAIILRTNSMSASPGKDTSFSVFVVGRTLSKPTFRWRVDGGRVTGSDNSTYVSVRPLRGVKRITVYTDVSGLSADCSTTVSQSLKVEKNRGIVDYGADVHSLEFDRDIIDGSHTEPRVRITTWAVAGFPGDPIVYHYEIASGRILGSGKEVIWDLTGVPSGEYSITAWVDDGCGPCGLTKTRKVIIK